MNKVLVWFKKYWIALAIALVTAMILALAGWKINSWYSNRPEVFCSTYSGIRWIRESDEKAEVITVSFDGERSKEIPFQGDVTIRKDSEILFQFLDCYIYRDLHSGYHVILPDQLTEELLSQGALGTNQNYGFLLVSDDWSKVTFVYLSDTPEWKNGFIEDVYTAPADSVAEAVAVSAEVAQGTFFEDNFYIK